MRRRILPKNTAPMRHPKTTRAVRVAFIVVLSTARRFMRSGTSELCWCRIVNVRPDRRKTARDYRGITSDGLSTFITCGGHQEREGFFHGCIILGIARFASRNDKFTSPTRSRSGARSCRRTTPSGCGGVQISYTLSASTGTPSHFAAAARSVNSETCSGEWSVNMACNFG